MTKYSNRNRILRDKPPRRIEETGGGIHELKE